jgi:hypothetical protein
MSRSTWNSPYHLFMPINSTATGVLSWVGFKSGVEFAVVLMA